MSARSHGDDLSLTGSQISTRSSLKKSSSARQLNRPSSAAGPKTSQGVSQIILTRYINTSIFKMLYFAFRFEQKERC